MSAVSENEAFKILEPFHDRIRAVVERAWSECRSVADYRAANGFGALLYPRTVSNDMFDAIARQVISEFGSEDGVFVRLEAQTLKVFFGGHLVARFKRGARNKLGRNIPTQAVMNFIEADQSLPGMPKAGGKVEIVWMSNEIQTKLEQLLVVARDGNKLLWDYSIEGAADVVDIVRAPTESEDDDTGDLVKPKLPTEQEEVE